MLVFFLDYFMLESEHLIPLGLFVVVLIRCQSHKLSDTERQLVFTVCFPAGAGQAIVLGLPGLPAHQQGDCALLPFSAAPQKGAGLSLLIMCVIFQRVLAITSLEEILTFVF